jgi:hypothetical protein
MSRVTVAWPARWSTMHRTFVFTVAAVVFVAALTLNRTAPGSCTNVDWPAHRGDQTGNQYSPLAEIHAATGRELWSFDPSKYNEGNAVIRLRTAASYSVGTRFE